MRHIRYIVKVERNAQLRNRYNKVACLTWDTTLECCIKLKRKHNTKVSPLLSGDHKA